MDNLSKHIVNYIKNAKTYYLTPEKIRKRLSKEKWIREQITFSQVALKIYEDYQNELKSSGHIDFEDMINITIESLKNSPELLKGNYDHILVDEYQDISRQRYELIKTIMEKNQNCKLFCVGDDWQSIMSFAGSDPEFFINFDKYFNHPARTDLTFNYRSIKSIVETGNELIKYNGEQQLSKKVIANNEQIAPINVFYLMHKENYKWKYYKQMVEDCIERIKYHLDNGYESDEIMVLTRITKNPVYKGIFDEYVNNNNISFSSIHKSKGLQSKIVFLLDMKEGVYGFPCQLHNSIIFEPARMEIMSDKIAEERRLFYVAVTRAKEKLYVYSQKSNPSRFLNEMGKYVNEQIIGY